MSIFSIRIPSTFSKVKLMGIKSKIGPPIVGKKTNINSYQFEGQINEQGFLLEFCRHKCIPPRSNHFGLEI